MTSMVGVTGSRGYQDFLEVYVPGQAAAWEGLDGLTLLHVALGNNDPAARVAISNHLLNDGADAAAAAPRGMNALHILFGQNDHDFEAETPLLKRLLDGGADVNRVAGKAWGTPLQTLISSLKYDDAELEPFYGVLFAQPDLDLLRAGLKGRSTFESARLSQSRRALVVRMEQYLDERGLTAARS